MDLIKKVEENKQKVFTLAKELKISSQRMEVVLLLDTSGSMSGHFQSGLVQDIMSTLLPIALTFDDDGKIPVYGFSNSAYKFPTDLTLNNLSDYVDSKMKPKWGGTSYAPGINMIVEDWKKSKQPSKGLFGLLNGKKKTEDKIPTYVIMITDGFNDDVSEAEQAMRKASEYPIYFMTVGAGGGRFPMLESLDNLSGRKRDNAGFMRADLSAFKLTSDPDALYRGLLEEIPAFVQSCLDDDLID